MLQPIFGQVANGHLDDLPCPFCSVMYSIWRGKIVCNQLQGVVLCFDLPTDLIPTDVMLGPWHIPMELWYQDHQILGVWDWKVWYLSPNLGPLEQTCMVPWPTESYPFQSMSDSKFTKSWRFDLLSFRQVLHNFLKHFPHEFSFLTQVRFCEKISTLGHLLGHYCA